MTKKEKQLWIAYSNSKSLQNRNALIEQYYDYVWSIAFKLYKSLNAKPDELITDGVLGLIDSIDKFDHTINDNFLLYSKFRIKGSMIDSYRSYKKSRSNIEFYSYDSDRDDCIDEHDGYAHLEFIDEFEYLIRSLSETEKIIAYKRFVHRKKLKEIGKEVGIIESRVSQILNKNIIPVIKKELIRIDFQKYHR